MKALGGARSRSPITAATAAGNTVLTDRAAGCFSVRPSFDERGERSRFVSFKL